MDGDLLSIPYPMKLPLHLSRSLAAWHVVAALTLAGGGAALAAPLFGSINSVSDILGVAHETDPLLINPWGMAIGPDGNLHVSDDGSGVSTVYQPDGTLLSGTAGIAIPSVSGTVPGSPTGIAENDAALLIKSDTNDFDITSGTSTAPAHYLYGTEDGEIVGYRQTVDSTNGIVEVTKTNGAGYTGVTLSWTGTTNTTLHHILYAADFALGTIDTYDATFAPAALTGTFGSENPPPVPNTAPAGSVWSPFNVKSVDYEGLDSITRKPGLQRLIIVAYALHSGTSNVLNDIPGRGYGYVDAFRPDGTWVSRVVDAGQYLDSPWAIAYTHHPFLNFGTPVLLVGSHGDGTIRAYALLPGTALSWHPFGALVKDKLGDPLAFDGLWAVKFGRATISEELYQATHAVLDENNHELYFTAGILGETHGVAGQILVP
jgi:uncharacterized protein (TIGR03118 family)